MQGLPLNHQLLDLSAVFVQTVQTAACYRMYDLGGIKPSLIRQPLGQAGHTFELELWDLPMANVGAFLACGPLNSQTHCLQQHMRQYASPHHGRC